MKIVANSDKFLEAQRNFNVVPMARVATQYEKNLQKIFSEDKVTLETDTYKLKAYQKEIGDFEVSSLINRQFLQLEDLQIGTIGDSKKNSIYQGQIKDGLAHGIGRVASAQFGIYEGMWADGMPAGFGAAVDQHSNHYEGIVSFKKSDSTILCDGEGTYNREGNSIKGTYGKGNLKIADDKDQ